MAAITNYLSYIYIDDTFDMNQSLYFLLSADSLQTTRMSLFIFLTHFISFLIPGDSTGIIFCSVLQISIILPVIVSPLIGFMISFIR